MISIVEQSGQAMATAGVGLIAAAAVGAMGIKNLVDTSVEYERQVRHTITQIDNFKGSVTEIGDIGRRVAREFAVPFEEIQPALFDIFSSTEATVKQSEMLLRAFAKAAVAGQVDIQDTSRATIGILNAFSLPLEDVNRILDIQFQLVKEGVGDYSEWATKIGLVSPSAARAGQTVEMMAAALATATRMGMTAARASTSVARAFDAMSNPKVIDKLKKMGINARDAAGHMRPLNDVLRDLRTAIMKLPEKDRVAALLNVFEGAGSTIEARRFLQTMLLVPGTLEQFDSILGNIENSTGSLDTAYKTMSNSVASQTELLSNRWKLLKEGLGTALTPAFLSIVTAISGLLDKFNALNPRTKTMIAQFLVWGVALSAVAGVILVLLGGLAVMVAAFSAAGGVLFPIIGIILGVVAAVTGLSVGLYALYRSSSGLQTYFAGGVDMLKQLWEWSKKFGQGLRQAWDEDVAPALSQMASYINEWVIPAFTTFRNEVWGKAAPALKELGKYALETGQWLMNSLGSALRDWVLPAIKSATEAWIEHRDKIMPVIDVLITVLKWFGMIAVFVGGALAFVLGGTLIGIIALVIKAFGWIISIIGNCIAAWNGMVAVVRTVIAFFGMLNSGIKDKVGDAIGFLQGIPGRIQAIFSGLGSLLVDAGRQLMQGLVDGIRQMVGVVEDTLAWLTSKIPDWKGPLSKDKGLLVGTGMAIMGGLVAGFRKAMPSVEAALGDVTTNVSNFGGGPDNANFRRPDIPPPGPDSSGGSTKNYYITQNITTQEINPVRQAAALGWEVQTVM